HWPAAGARDLSRQDRTLLLRRAVLEVLPDQTPPRGSAAPNRRRHGVQARTRANAAAGEPRHHQPDPADRSADRRARRQRCGERARVAEGARWRGGFLDSTNRWDAVRADRDRCWKRTTIPSRPSIVQEK